MKKIICSTLFDIFFIFWTILCAIFGFPIGMSKKYAIYLGKFWANGVLIALNFFCNIKYECKDLEKMQGLSLILSKHQSAWETIFFLAKIKNVTFVIKENLLKIPFYGWYLQNMGMIPVARKISIMELKNMNKKIIQSIQSKKTVIIFPQGTRTNVVNNNIVKYKFGCLDIFNNISGKIGLVALNSGLFWKSGFTIKNNGTILVKLIDIKNNKSEDFINLSKESLIQMKKEIQEKINSESEKIYFKK